MAGIALTERYAANLHGVLLCYDRIIVTGTLPGAYYAGGQKSPLPDVYRSGELTPRSH